MFIQLLKKLIALPQFQNKPYITQKGPVTKMENIKTDATKILRPTHFGE